VSRRLALFAAAAALLSGLVWADLASRARRAYLEGERYMEWHAHPERQRAYWDSWLAGEEARRGALVAAGRMSAEESRLRAGLARAERDERVAEDPLKYAVRWYETGADLFSTPPNPWTARTRTRLEEARALWRGELAASGLKPEEFSYH